MELTIDNLKLEDELEKAINGDLEINTKTQQIKHLLSRMVTVDASIVKFTSMMTNNNNDESIPQNNGTN